MDVGIGLPNAVRGVDRAGIVEWAKRAEAAGFSSLGTIDRIAYPNYESMIALGAAAAVTEKIGLVTDILLGPVRSSALLAKQAATVDSLSGGRLTLGIAVGGREDDYEAVGVPFQGRGKLFDRQLDEITSIWKGETKVGPPPANGERPALLIGGGNDKTFRRAAKYADGWTMGGGPPDAFAEAKAKLESAWQAEGRDGSPRTLALCYFVLGDNAEETARENIGDYYAWLGEYADGIVQSAAKDADTIKGYISAFEQVGADELICFPGSADPAQVDLLAEAIK